MATHRKTMPAVGPGCSPVSRLESCLCGGHRKTTEEVDSLPLHQETQPVLQVISIPPLTLHIQPKSTEFQSRPSVFMPGAAKQIERFKYS